MNAFHTDDDDQRSAQRAPVARAAAARSRLREFDTSVSDDDAPGRCKQRRREGFRLTRLNAGRRLTHSAPAAALKSP
jgi:hypothetical protein